MSVAQGSRVFPAVPRRPVEDSAAGGGCGEGRAERGTPRAVAGAADSDAPGAFACGSTSSGFGSQWMQ